LHTYAKGEHKVSVSSHDHGKWQTTVSSASGHRHTGTGVSALEKHLISKNKRYREGNEMDQVITEGHGLRFASPSRTQLAKVATYFSIGRATGGLGRIIISSAQGGPGNWFFDVTMNGENQFLDPRRLNNIIPAEVTVTAIGGPSVVPQKSSQDEIRNCIREMVEERLQRPFAEGLDELRTPAPADVDKAIHTKLMGRGFTVSSQGQHHQYTNAYGDASFHYKDGYWRVSKGSQSRRIGSNADMSKYLS